MSNRKLIFFYHLKNNFFIYIILVLLFLLRFLLQAPYLEDWDSVQFAQALNHYSLIDHQPHPPGYPVYIFLGKILNLVISNPGISLTLVSVISGSLSILFFYFLSKQLTDKKNALFSSFLFASLPIHWTLSEVALSNIPGEFFTILTAFFVYKGKSDSKYLYLGCLIGGITLGVRFAEYSTVLSLIVLVLLYHKKIKTLIYSVAIFSAGILLWLLPLITITGVPEFISLYTKQAEYIAFHDSSFSTNNSLRERLFRIKTLLIMGWTKFFIFPLLLCLIYYLKNWRIKNNFNLIFVLTWFFSYIFLLIFIYNLEVPRHILPLSTPVILLSALALKYFKNRLLIILYIISSLFIFIQAFDQVKSLHSLIPPTVSPVVYIKQNLPSDKTILVTTFTYRQFQYYAPEYQNYYEAKSVQSSIDSQYVVIDLIQTRDQLPNLKNYKINKIVTFEQSELIFPRVYKTKIYILEKSNSQDEIISSEKLLEE